MTFGFRTWRADGTPIITPNDAGGVFADMVVRQPEEGSGSITYTELNGQHLRVFQVYPGAFTWTTGVDAAGNPFIYFTRNTATILDSEIRLLVFAI